MRRMHIRCASLLLGLAFSVGPSHGQSSSYQCDPTVCKLPSCACGSSSPPGGISVQNAPQFLMLTFDDAVQTDTYGVVTALTNNRKNPNGCPVHATFFTQTYYTDPILVTQLHAQGHEIALHSMSHGAYPPPPAPQQWGVYDYIEYEGNRAYLNRYAGIPLDQIKGLRFPFLNFSANALNMISKMGVQWESSASAGSSGMFWPYTYDYGQATGCTDQINVCGSTSLNAKGLWEIPLYETGGASGIHLMDPYNDPSITNPISLDTVYSEYVSTFETHYAIKVPFGVYTHPVWLTNETTSPNGLNKQATVSQFLDYAMAKGDVWMVTGSQLIEYMKNPVPASQLGSQPYMQCNNTAPTNICNGLGPASLAETCNFITGTIHTCYGCPSAVPDIPNPLPAPASSRQPLPTNCDPLWWDPVAGKCLCTSSSCAYSDTGRAINFDQTWLNPSSSNNGQSSGSTPTGSGAKTSPTGASGKSTSAGESTAPRIYMTLLASVSWGAWLALA